MRNLRSTSLAVVLSSATLLMLGTVAPSAEESKPAAKAPVAKTPTFKVDPTWPLEMPNHWIMGAVTGVFVDAKQHVWVTHLPETLTEEELYEEPWNVVTPPAPPGRRGRRHHVPGFFVEFFFGQCLREVRDPHVLLGVHKDSRDRAHDPVVGHFQRPGRVDLEGRRLGDRCLGGRLGFFGRWGDGAQHQQGCRGQDHGKGR